jgi:hypothetical protein
VTGSDQRLGLDCDWDFLQDVVAAGFYIMVVSLVIWRWLQITCRLKKGKVPRKVLQKGNTIYIVYSQGELLG